MSASQEVDEEKETLMTDIHAAMTLAEAVDAFPELAREFERRGLDYCCGGGRTLGEACALVGADPDETIAELAGALAVGSDGAVWTTMPADALVDHLETTHHRYLWDELPRVTALVDKIVSVHGTRHPDILKLWLSLLHVGREGFASIIDHSYELAEHFVAEVKRRPFLRLAYVPEMNIVTFRGEPKGMTEDRIDEWNAALQDYLLHTANAFLSLPLLRGRRWLKAVLLNPYLDKKTISDIFTHVDEFHAKRR